MLRKIRRNAAKLAMKKKKISLFNKYSKVETLVKNKRTGHFELADVARSFFALNWRKYSLEYVKTENDRGYFERMKKAHAQN